MGAVRRPDGGVRLEGRSPPDALVRLLSPETGALGTAADAQGAWVLDLPAAAAPRLYALSADAAGRTLRAEGALAILPAPALAALTLRAGAAAWPAAGAAAGVRLATVDFDGGGGVGAAGLAAPGAQVRLSIDGAAAGAGQADAAGRFALLAVRAPLPPGQHAVRVEAPSGAGEASVATGPGPALGARPYAATRAANGWRIDWAPPGGGVQSRIALDQAQP